MRSRRFYIEDRYADEIPEETDSEPIGADGKIDLAPSLLGAVTIEIPFAPVHDEDCAGLCATCGADLNEGACGCHDGSDEEHPFGALKALLSEESKPGRLRVRGRVTPGARTASASFADCLSRAAQAS